MIPLLVATLASLVGCTASPVYNTISGVTVQSQTTGGTAKDELTGERLPPPEPLPAVLQDAPTQPGSPSEAVALAAAALSGLAEGGAPRPTAEAALSFSV